MVDKADGFTPVLTDFGVAKILEGVQFTGTGMTIGTPDYMAPEQGGGGEVTCGADLYSLGVILYEMLAGELPFTADTPVAVLLKHISDTPPSVRMRVPDLPPELDQVLERALAKDAADRYPSGAALVDAVEQAWGLDAPTLPPPGRCSMIKRSVVSGLLVGIAFVLVSIYPVLSIYARNRSLSAPWLQAAHPFLLILSGAAALVVATPDWEPGGSNEWRDRSGPGIQIGRAQRTCGRPGVLCSPSGPNDCSGSQRQAVGVCTHSPSSLPTSRS